MLCRKLGPRRGGGWLQLHAGREKIQNCIAGAVWEFSEKFIAANCCFFGSKFHVVLRNVFRLSFYCDKLELGKKKKHPTGKFNAQNVSHLLAGIFALFSWHKYACEVFLGLIWCFQSNPVEAETLCTVMARLQCGSG